MSGDVLIVGGGIGGLTAALALRAAGVRAEVFEQAGELRGIGGAVTLQAGAREVMDAVGMAEAVRGISGTPHERVLLRSAKGKVLTSFPQDAVTVHRRDLLLALAAELDDDVVHLNSRCLGFEQDDGGVTVRFEGGREERGAALVGADGIFSVVRRQLVGDPPLRYSGFAGWRAMPRFSHPALREGVSNIALGRGMRFGILPSSTGRVYWFGWKAAAEGSPDLPAPRKRVLLEWFRGWYEPVEELIEATDEDDIIHNQIFDRPPLASWGSGRVTMVGDAAHVSVPTLGQGASQAIEDGPALARQLAGAAHGNSGAVQTALRAYESERLPPANEIVERAWGTSRSNLWTNPVLCWARDTKLRLRR